MARSRGMDTGSATGLVLAALIVASWLAEQPRWAQILITVSVVVTALGLWALFRMPTSCKVANRTKAYPCNNPVKGMLSACHLPDHKARKRKLIWARLRGRPHATPLRAPSHTTRPRKPDAAAPVSSHADGYQLAGAGYHLTMLVFTILGGIGGAAGVVSTVHALTGG
jgi:hypothetical protein